MDADNSQNPSTDAPVIDAQVVVLAEYTRTPYLDALLNQETSLIPSWDALAKNLVLGVIPSGDVSELVLELNKTEHEKKCEKSVSDFTQESFVKYRKELKSRHVNHC